MINKKKIQLFLIIPFISIYLYVPYIKISSISFFTGYVLFFIPWIFLLKKNKLIIYKENINILYLLLFSLSIVCITYLFNINNSLTTLDLRGLKLHLSIVFIFLSTYAIYNWLFLELDNNKFLKIIYYSASVNVVLIIALFMSQDFINIFYSLIEVNPRIFTYGVPRYSGLPYDGFSYVSVFNAYLFIIGLILYFEDNNISFIEKLILLVFQMFIFISIIFVGRTGFIVIALGIGMFFLYQLYTKKLMKKSNIKKYLYLLGIGIFLVFIGLYVIDYLGMNWYIEWAFSFINNLFIDGSKDSSVNELVQNHYFLPNSIVDLLIGISDFHSTEQSTYHSDVGYVIYIYGTGLIGIFAFLFILFRILFDTFRYFEHDKAIGFLIIFIILSLLIINFKDFYIFYPYSHYILLFLLLMKFNSNKRINREK